jgi:hypothetical protein
MAEGPRKMVTKDVLQGVMPGFEPVVSEEIKPGVGQGLVVPKERIKPGETLEQAWERTRREDGEQDRDLPYQAVK